MIRKKTSSRTLSNLIIQIDQEPASIKNLKKNLALLEIKTSEAKIMRTSLKARIEAAKLNGQSTQTNASSAMAAFERMENRVRQLEARSQTAAELAGSDLESQFRALESGNLDLELEAMKQQMLAGCSLQLDPATDAFCSQQQEISTIPHATAIDDELEDLMRQLDKL